MNITYNWWGVANEAEIRQRIFDMDDWNIFTIGEFSPFYSTEEHFIDFWWFPKKGQILNASRVEPPAQDLKGRLYESMTLSLNKEHAERWYQFPYYYRPFRPYRIIRDLTIMPGATLTIERNVEVHVWPNVRILVLGNLICDGTLWQPIRFKPINTTELAEERGKIGTRYKRSVLYRRRNKKLNPDYNFVQFVKERKKRAYRAGYDPVYRQFPTLRRNDPYFQQFSVSLTKNSTIPGRAGFLQIYNATSGETVPSCDRQFTIRNAQVVCRELGLETQNVYHWITPRYDYNPLTHVLKNGYMEPRECIGTEPKLDKCGLRLTGNNSMWQCMDNEHFNYIHCGTNVSLSREYIGNWGGITFSSPTLEVGESEGKDASKLLHVEIVGGGYAHNDSFQSGALQVIRRAPSLENVNITNSSMHGLQLISPRDSIILSRLNVSDNKGQGVNILSTNLQSANPTSPTPKGPLNIPYFVTGLLDICSAGKKIEVKNRIIVYYKYDSFPVDCVKIFTSPTRNLGFRFLQVNLYGATNDLGRSDALNVYGDSTFSPAALLHRFTHESIFTHTILPIQSNVMGLHMRGTAADGEYGFIAEVTLIPTTPSETYAQEIAIRNSRLINNDRGALQYRNTGEVGPNVIIEQCAIENNGYFLYGNISTSMQAMELHLHNTLLLIFRSNAVTHNRGGLLVTAQSSSAVAQLKAVIKNSGFTMNSNSTTLAFLGNDYQQVTLLNNVISLNFALYFDTVLVKGFSANFTRNLFTNNTGAHIVDTEGYSRISSDAQTFYYNMFADNLALGHGNQYIEKFGYLPMGDDNEFHRRPKRQVQIPVFSQQGVSFDWWTHVGNQTSRYRSTILAGSSHQKFYHNIFYDNLNDYELATSAQTTYDIGAIDAKENYWGYPGTPGVAAGKIRDQADYPYLIRVDFEPVLESNTSLLEGDCPPGWFQIGTEEFKSCYLFVGASLTYAHAVKFCEELDAFMPILRNDDTRQKELANRIDNFAQTYITETERFYSFGSYFDIPIWISSVTLPINQCGWMSSRTGSIGEQNCNNLLPFVCERGTKPYQEPIMWRRDIILAIVLVIVLACLLALLAICWCMKSRKRKEEFFTRKEFIRDSIRRSKQIEMERKRSFDQLKNGHITNGSNFGPKTEKSPANVLKSYSPMLPRKVANGTRSSASTDSSHSDHTYSTPTHSTKTCTDSLCTDHYSDTNCTASTIRPAVPMRNPVSAIPNPYDDVSTFRNNKKPILTGPRRETDISTTSSQCTSCIGSGSCTARTCTTCSTCQDTSTDRNSTITEESEEWASVSSSARSSQVSSDSTLTERPLLKPSSGTRSSLSTLKVSSRPDLSSQRYADYFQGSGRPLLSPSRSNPSIYQPPQPIPVDPPRVPPLHGPFTNGVSHGRRPSFHSTSQDRGPPKSPLWTIDPMGPRTDFTRNDPPPSYKPKVEYGSIPVAGPFNPELQATFSHSPSSTGRNSFTSNLPSAPSPGRPRHPPPQVPDWAKPITEPISRPKPSRSLVDLYNPHYKSESGDATGKRSSSGGGLPLETAM
uniref:SRCR domain-containing protein n=1 Tax=Acrobeloides nanus TaxID=290746 RepID=A0A914EF37_9BILA